MGVAGVRCFGLIAVLLLAACSSPSPRAVPPPPSLSQSASAGAASPAVPSSGGPRDIECSGHEAHIKINATRAADDVVAGSIGWPGLRGWASGSPTDHGDPATGDYKLGAEVKAGAVVTVSVPDALAGVAGLNYGQGWGYSPARSVTFHACADSDTAFIGGFHLSGPPRCVPLDIAENGRPPARVTVSFFAGPC